MHKRKITSHKQSQTNHIYTSIGAQTQTTPTQQQQSIQHHTISHKQHANIPTTNKHHNHTHKQTRQATSHYASQTKHTNTSNKTHANTQHITYNVTKQITSSTHKRFNPLKQNTHSHNSNTRKTDNIT